jgi:predicted anti-sigma-YlaC factor YlaD
MTATTATPPARELMFAPNCADANRLIGHVWLDSKNEAEATAKLDGHVKNCKTCQSYNAMLRLDPTCSASDKIIHELMENFDEIVKGVPEEKKAEAVDAVAKPLKKKHLAACKKCQAYNEKMHSKTPDRRS